HPGHVPFPANPAVVILRPFCQHEALFPGGKLHGETMVRIDHEGGTVKYQLVLAPDLIEINEWQPRLHHTGQHDTDPRVGFCPIERRTVGDNQYFRAALAQTFGYVLTPDVFADWHAKANTTEIDGTGHRAGFKHPLLVKDTV